MNRQIIHCLAFGLTVSLLGFGCGRGQRGIKTPDQLSEKDKEQATVAYRVEGILGQIQDEHAVNRRATGAKGAGLIARNPELTAEQRAKLIDALKKALETEHDEEAKTAENEALATLQGSG